MTVTGLPPTMTATGAPDLHIPEIVDSIIGFLDPTKTQDAYTLVSCKNVSSTFFRSAQKSTFRSVVLVPWKNATSGFNCSRLLTALSRYPEIALFVKHLDLQCESTNAKEDILELPDILELLKNLESISVTNIGYAFTELLDLIRSVTCRKDVQHISLCGGTNDLASPSIYSVLLNGAKGVKELYFLDYWGIQDPPHLRMASSIQSTEHRATLFSPSAGSLAHVRALKIFMRSKFRHATLLKNLVSSQPAFDLAGLEDIDIIVSYAPEGFLMLQDLLSRTQRSLRSLRMQYYFGKPDSSTQ
jgi:hypothetical protein